MTTTPRKFPDGAKVVSAFAATLGKRLKVVSAAWQTDWRGSCWLYRCLGEGGERDLYFMREDWLQSRRLPRLELYDDKQRKIRYYRLVDADGNPVNP